ncbi:MAG: CRISPR-associated helicase Cas3' [Candidatus Accumulibacter sp.]|jgi:CRISPR-associated endonuclease/helicase Cas3|nr:CRISPR-associated helicase Cas3' [Accumulibacter sp.]
MMAEQLGYWSYWGKADKKTHDDDTNCHFLVYHCLDVAAVGYEYLARSKAFGSLLTSYFPSVDRAIFQDWLAFWLSLHDLGKFAQAFQGQRPDLVQNLWGNEHETHKIYDKRHDTLGWWLWKQKLEGEIASERWFGDASDFLSSELLDAWTQAVMGHHGLPPESSLLNGSWQSYFHRDDAKAAWDFARELRGLFLSRSEVANFPNFLDAEIFIQRSRQISWWIAGLTVLADWLGSNQDFFPYRDTRMSLQEYWSIARRCARAALSASGALTRGEREEQAFGQLFPGIATPSPLQRWACEAEVSAHPQLFMLEDVTGAGKTEAAVMLAHRLIVAEAANGFFIGLPTMATANAMYGRIAQVYMRLFSSDASLALAHSHRALVEDCAASVVPAGPCSPDYRQHDSSATARCTAWLADHNKRALLSAAGVGTLDQALLAVLYSRHQSLRLLGLLGKVLIVDEVHACDAYMQKVLEVLLEFHARSGGSAILLSATLARRMKQSLLRAFAHGCGQDAPPLAEEAYPLVTVWRSDAPAVLEETPLDTRKDVSRGVYLCYLSDEADVLQVIDQALDAGRCVCWMRNTIGDAFSAWKKFRDRLDDEHLILFHSRFALQDRLTIEARILECFGKESNAEKRRGKLVIATQVVEQSLDADWDLVISDLAPIDRLIQRAGRLLRHCRDEEGNPLREQGADRRGEARLYIYGPAWTEAPEADWLRAKLPGTAAVYEDHGKMWLSASAMQQEKMTMPCDARDLIEAVFGDDVTLPNAFQENARRMEGREYADASMAQMNTLSLGGGYTHGGFDWWGEAKAPTRTGEKSVQVILVCWEAGCLRPWSRKSRKNARHALAYSTLSVPGRLISSGIEPTDPEQRRAWHDLLESLPGQGQWSVPLMLEKTDGVWQGWSDKPEGRGRTAEKPVQWRYDPMIGLMVVNTAGE